LADVRTLSRLHALIDLAGLRHGDPTQWLHIRATRSNGKIGFALDAMAKAGNDPLFGSTFPLFSEKHLGWRAPAGCQPETRQREHDVVSVSLGRHDWHLLLAQYLDQLLISIQVGLDQFGRR
jgi:hypothetical protein